MVNLKTGESQISPFEGGLRGMYYPVYHPAAALYQGNLKKDLERDFAKIPKILERIS